MIRSRSRSRERQREGERERVNEKVNPIERIVCFEQRFEKLRRIDNQLGSN